MMQLRTFKVENLFAPDRPTGPWDPRWNDPAIASKMAAERLKVVGHEIGSGVTNGLLAPANVPVFPKNKTEHRTFALVSTAEVGASGPATKTGGFGEIYRPYSFGRDKVYFHVQNLVFGADATGLGFVEAVVGRVQGGWGCSAALSVKFLADLEPVTGLLWQGELDPPQNVNVCLVGRSDALREAFPSLTTAAVLFFSQQRGGGGAQTPR
jgi:hypothetical protein